MISRSNEHIIKDMEFNFDKFHVCVNLDYFLSLTREIMDLTMIIKTYTRKWNFKYKVKEFIKQSFIDTLNFAFNESQFIWYMSYRRFVVFRLAGFFT